MLMVNLESHLGGSYSMYFNMITLFKLVIVHINFFLSENIQFFNRPIHQLSPSRIKPHGSWNCLKISTYTRTYAHLNYLICKGIKKQKN